MSFQQFTLTEAVRALPDVQAAAEQDGLAVLVRRGKPLLIVVRADLFIRVLMVADQIQRFLSDPAIAHLVQITGLFWPAVSALDDAPLKKPGWLSETLADLQTLAEDKSGASVRPKP